jgi:hypothetical protein
MGYQAIQSTNNKHNLCSVDQELKSVDKTLRIQLNTANSEKQKCLDQTAEQLDNNIQKLRSRVIICTCLVNDQQQSCHQKCEMNSFQCRYQVHRVLLQKLE